MLLRKTTFLKPFPLQANDADFIALDFKFKSPKLLNTTYNLELIQRNEKGKIIGGESIVIESPTISKRAISITAESIGNGNVLLIADNEFSDLNWIDSYGEVIGSEATIVVHPALTAQEYFVSAYTEDGEWAEGEILVDIPNGIESVSASPSLLKVILREEALETSQIKLLYTLNSSKDNVITIPEGEKEIYIETSSFVKGLYILHYMIDNKIIDIRKVVIE